MMDVYKYMYISFDLCVRELTIGLANFKDEFARVWFNIVMTSYYFSFATAEIDKYFSLAQTQWKMLSPRWSCQGCQ